MKLVISRFIIFAILVVSSVGVCLSNDKNCDDSTSYSQSQNTQSSSATQDQNEGQHCTCSLSCHNLLIGFTSSQTKSILVAVTTSPFLYIQSSYPLVLITHDKPPII